MNISQYIYTLYREIDICFIFNFFAIASNIAGTILMSFVGYLTWSGLLAENMLEDFSS
jgi:nitrogen fixation protein FixH